MYTTRCLASYRIPHGTSGAWHHAWRMVPRHSVTVTTFCFPVCLRLGVFSNVSPSLGGRGLTSRVRPGAARVTSAVHRLQRDRDRESRSRDTTRERDRVRETDRQRELHARKERGRLERVVCRVLDAHESGPTGGRYIPKWGQKGTGP